LLTAGVMVSTGGGELCARALASRHKKPAIRTERATKTVRLFDG